MAKSGKSSARTIFVCQQCGREELKWLGRCPNCQQWNTFVEKTVAASATSFRSASPLNPPQELSQVVIEAADRFPLPLTEFNRVLGGGLVPGSLILIGGDPGIGKSTLLLQVSALVAQARGRVIYVSGEETQHQIKLRAERLGIKGKELYLLAETDLEVILSQIEELSPSLVIIDSIQAVYLSELDTSPGSITQVRECAMKLMHWAKLSAVPVFIVGHVTKDGAIAGPRVLEHIVDAVLYLEGEAFSAHRLLRCVKNRFGSTNEIGVFEMKGQGLVEDKLSDSLLRNEFKVFENVFVVEATIKKPEAMAGIIKAVEKNPCNLSIEGFSCRSTCRHEIGVFEMKGQGLVEVENPSQAFLSQRWGEAIGSVVVPVLEGSRPLLVEIQALTNYTSFGLPRRTANGVDFGRLLLISAVLTKRIGLKLGNQDIMVNVTGGLKIGEPAADLGIALAITSSFRDVGVDPELAAVGEVGLSGELRAVSQLDRRVNEAARLGFKRCLVPKVGARVSPPPKDIELIPASSLREAIGVGLVRRKTKDTQKSQGDNEDGESHISSGSRHHH